VNRYWQIASGKPPMNADLFWMAAALFKALSAEICVHLRLVFVFLVSIRVHSRLKLLAQTAEMR
jgi:hypothetical protein